MSLAPDTSNRPLTAPTPADLEAALINKIRNVSYETHGCALERKCTQTQSGLTRYTVMRVDPQASVRILEDTNFYDLGIKADGILINQRETQAYWSGELNKSTQVGKTPEDFLNEIVGNAVAHYMNHFGWQYGECIIKSGQMRVLDRDFLLPRQSSVLCKMGQSWIFRDIPVSSISHGFVSDVELGFSLPLIVQAGKSIPISDLLDHPRFKADPRNGINFTPGGAAAEFFPPFREGPLMLIGSAEYRLLYKGETFSVPGKTKLTGQGYKILQAAMTDQIKEYIDILFDGEETTLIVKKPLPKQSIPAYIIGTTEDNRLVTIAVDGRQPGRSAGATFEELQRIALEEGLHNAGLGPAGNDVVDLVRTDGEYFYASSPSGGGSRPLPAVLVISKS